jgi:glycerophosphoryl diester phosphodiesterase
MVRGRTAVVRAGGTSRIVGLLAFGLALAAMLLTLVVAGAGAAPGDATRAAPELNIGHRGASGYAPEHTLPAYDLALEQGTDYIEQDLQMTADGVLVVLHDETLDRTARPTGASEPGDCTGPVRSKTLAQIKTCEVGRWFNQEYPRRAQAEYVGLKIPTLEQVFRRYGKGTNYYIETKSPALYPQMEDELLRLMDKYELRKPARENWRVLIQSFDPASLKEIHAQAPSLPLIQLYSDTETSATIQASLETASGYAVGVGPSKDDVDAELIEAAHDRCLDVHPYTVNKQSEMESLIALGVDGMFTNFPRRLENVLGDEAAPGSTGAALAADEFRSCVTAN